MGGCGSKKKDEDDEEEFEEPDVEPAVVSFKVTITDNDHAWN